MYKFSFVITYIFLVLACRLGLLDCLTSAAKMNKTASDLSTFKIFELFGSYSLERSSLNIRLSPTVDTVELLLLLLSNTSS